MQENRFSPLGKLTSVACIAALTAVALVNVWRGEIQRPHLFIVILTGFVFFAAAKISVLARSCWVSFGTRRMTPAMGNAYRFGYWLMFLGFLATFS